MKRSSKRPAESPTPPRYGSAVADGLIAGMETLLEELESGKLEASRIRIVIPPIRVDAEGVKAARGALGLSQTLFADFIGASASAVRAWERGAKLPTPMAQRFLHAIRTDPVYWRSKLAPFVAEKP